MPKIGHLKSPGVETTRERGATLLENYEIYLKMVDAWEKTRASDLASRNAQVEKYIHTCINRPTSVSFSVHLVRDGGLLGGNRCSGLFFGLQQSQCDECNQPPREGHRGTRRGESAGPSPRTVTLIVHPIASEEEEEEGVGCRAQVTDT